MFGSKCTGFQEDGEKDGPATEISLFARKFRADPDPKDGFHPGNCQNVRERRVLEFLLPILNPNKAKRISLTMANTQFGAMSGVRPVNWGILIHELIEKSLPHIGRIPSFLSPFILHLYQQFDCFTDEEEDLLTIATDEVTYKLKLEAEVEDTWTETSSDPVVVEEPPTSLIPSFWKPTSPLPPPPHPEARPSREASWRDLDLSASEFLENPFKQIHVKLADLQT